MTLENTGKVFLAQGPSAGEVLASLGGGVPPVTMNGQAIAFDNTMFPDVPGSGFTTIQIKLIDPAYIQPATLVAGCMAGLLFRGRSPLRPLGQMGKECFLD